MKISQNDEATGPKRVCRRRLWQWSKAFVLMHQRKPFLHRTSNLKKAICAQRQTERGCNYCFTMCKKTTAQCARKKNYCTTCNSPILFITTSTGHHNQPQFSITTMLVVTTSTNANILTILGVEETLSTQCTLFIKSELFSGENSKKRPVGVCVHRDVLALLGNAAIWFHYSPLHYPLHLSILLLAQHTLNTLTQYTQYTQFVSVVVFAQYKLYLYEHWYLISLQPNDFKPTFVHITLLRLRSICICTRTCICLDRIYHCASEQNVSKVTWKNWVFSCRKRRWCSIFHPTCNFCPHLCPVAAPYLHTHNLCISVFVIYNFRPGLIIVQDIPFPPREYERNCLTSNNDIIPQLQNPNAPLTIPTLCLSLWIIPSENEFWFPPPAAMVGPLY